MFDMKELTKIMSMVVNESINLQKEINECNSELERESLDEELATVNTIGAKVSSIINK